MHNFDQLSIFHTHVFQKNMSCALVPCDLWPPFSPSTATHSSSSRPHPAPGRTAAHHARPTQVLELVTYQYQHIQHSKIEFQSRKWMKMAGSPLLVAKWPRKRFFLVPCLGVPILWQVDKSGRTVRPGDWGSMGVSGTMGYPKIHSSSFLLYKMHQNAMFGDTTVTAFRQIQVRDCWLMLVVQVILYPISY